MYALALRLLGDTPNEAEDVLQESWIRALRGMRTFAWNSTLRTWLCAIVVNCCRELWRKNREQVVVPEEEAVNEDLTTRIDVGAALARLPTGYRAVLVLHDIMGFTHEEIAQRLSIEAGTSKSQLSRARHAMRRMLGPRISVPNG